MKLVSVGRIDMRMGPLEYFDSYTYLEMDEIIKSECFFNQLSMKLQLEGKYYLIRRISTSNMVLFLHLMASVAFRN